MDLNPRVGFAWMRRGKQASVPTPGTNRKVWISGALNWLTGRLHWVVGPRKDSALFLKLLNELCRVYWCHRQLHIVVDNDGSHLSRGVQAEVVGSRGRICLHWLPPCLPEANPIELIWWRLHEAITCKLGGAGRTGRAVLGTNRSLPAAAGAGLPPAAL